jgi:putative ribosome biogenesis GTPase RsgA
MPNHSSSSTPSDGIQEIFEPKGINSAKLEKLLLDEKFLSPEKLAEIFPDGIQNSVFIFGKVGVGKSTLCNVLMVIRLLE